MLPIGTVVKVTKNGTGETYIGKVIGYDLHGSKYHINPQLYSNRFDLFANGVDCWAFPNEVVKYLP